jgi:hypothetical protein
LIVGAEYWEKEAAARKQSPNTRVESHKRIFERPASTTENKSYASIEEDVRPRRIPKRILFTSKLPNFLPGQRLDTTSADSKTCNALVMRVRH